MIAIGLVGPVLPGVENVKIGEPSERTRAIQAHVRPLWEGTTAKGHELVVGLVGVGASG